MSNTVDEFSISAVLQKRGSPAVPSTTPATSTSSTASSSSTELQVAPPSSSSSIQPPQHQTLQPEQPPAPPAAPTKAGFSLPVDPLRIIDIVYRRGLIALIIAASAAALGFLFGKLRIEPVHTAGAQVIRHEAPNVFRASETGDAFKPASVPIQLMLHIMRSKSLMERVSTALKGSVSPARILSGLAIVNERNSDLLNITWNSSTSPQEAVTVLNTYVQELIAHTRQMQSRDAADINRYLKTELARVEQQITAQNEALLRFAKEQQVVDTEKEITSHLADLGSYSLKYENLRLDYETLDIKISSTEREFSKASPLAGRLNAASQDLATLLLRYTEENPLVMEARQRVSSLEEQIKNDTGPRADAPPSDGANPVAAALYLELVNLRSQKDVLAQQLEKVQQTRDQVRQRLEQLPRKAMDYALLRDRRTALESARTIMSTRQREAELHEQNALGFCRQLAAARLEDVISDPRSSKVLLLTAGAGAAGLLLPLAALLYLGLRDGRVHTPADLKRATSLPVLATLPQPVIADAAQCQSWAFRTWTRLQPQLLSAQGSILCGLISDVPQRATQHFTALFAEAAGWRGSAIIVISPQPLQDQAHLPLTEALQPQLQEEADHWLSSERGIICLTYDPQQWQWTLSQRQQLEAALQKWSRHRGAVIFVELPPATQPESLLMAERMPQLIWVGRGSQSRVGSISEHMRLFRQAGCRFIGSFLHGGATLSPPVLNKLSGAAAALATLLLASSASAEQLPPPTAPQLPFVTASLSGQPSAAAAPVPTAALAAISAVAQPSTVAAAGLSLHAAEIPASTAEAAAQQPLPSGQMPVLLGPGDGVNLMMFGDTSSKRNEVGITPTGKISYLQAQDIPAAGLTLDQLRERITTALSRYYQNPRLIITPAGFNSRRVYLLGKVIKKGPVNFDRPLSILEAVTEAGGFETGLFQSNTVELADLGRSFLARQGQRVPVDFVALFNQGDISQNLPLQPGDYLYFPSANSNEIFVFGNVNVQGSQGLLAHTTVTSVVATAGGFTKKAYPHRVLVIRGSLSQPETHVVDMNAVLSGREKGFRLEPKDIVFVSDRPWARAEQILDYALSAFVMGSISTYANSQVLPLVTKPLFGE